MVWSDVQNGRIFANRVGSHGYPVGGVITVANSIDRAHQPSLAAGANKFVVVYTNTFMPGGSAPFPYSISGLNAVEIAPSTGTVLRSYVVINWFGYYHELSEPSVVARVEPSGYRFDVAFVAESDGDQAIYVIESYDDRLDWGFDLAPVATGTYGCVRPHAPTHGRGFTGLSLVFFTQLCPDGAGGLQQDLFIGSPGTAVAGRMTVSSGTSESSPSVVSSAWDGTLWLTWLATDTSGTSRPLVAKLDAAAVPLGGLNPQELPGVTTAPAIATNGRAVLVVWGDARFAAYGQDLFASRLSSEVEDLDPVDLWVANNWARDIRQEEPAVASSRDGKVNLIVWTERRDDSSGDIHGLLVDQDGHPILPGSAPIVVSATARPQGSPAVASDGKDFFVVWDEEKIGPDDSRIRGVVVLADGSVGKPVNLSRTTQGAWAEDPAVTFVAKNGVYVGAWQSDYGNGLDIYGNQIQTSGLLAFPGTDFGISLEPVDQRRVAIAAWHDSALVVWEEKGRGHPTVNVYGARLRGWAGFLPGPDLELTRDLDHLVHGDQYWPAVACSTRTDRCEVTVSSAEWQDLDRADIVALQVRLAPGDDSITWEKDFYVAKDRHEQRRSTVVYDQYKDHFFVAWEDFRDGYPAINGAKFRTDGSVWNSPGDRISLGLDPAAASLGHDRYLVVDQQAIWGVHRVIGRTLDP